MPQPMFGRLLLAFLALAAYRTIVPPAAEASLGDGLVAYYPLDGNAIDATGSGRDGTVVRAVATADRGGHPSCADHFDGVSHYLTADGEPGPW